MEESICLYDANTIDSLCWPATEDGEYAKRYLEPLVKNGTASYFNNIDAKVFVLNIGELVLPIIVGNVQSKNSYVCSPYGHYISYALQNLHTLKNPLLKSIAKSFLNSLGYILRKGNIDSIVYVNNWLFSIDLYPQGISLEKIGAITAFLKKQFPDKAIVFRSIDPFLNSDLLNSLNHQGFRLIASRNNYYADTKNDRIFQRRIVKSDFKLLKDSGYQVLDETMITTEDLPRLLELYKSVYIDNHSHLNADYSLSLIQLIKEGKVLGLRVLKREGMIDGVVGFHERNGVMMCPFFGYDKFKADHAVLYRLLNTVLITEARKKGLIFHAGAGASFFKKIRYPQTCMESIAVNFDHLPLKSQITWHLLRGYVKGVVAPFLKKY